MTNDRAIAWYHIAAVVGVLFLVGAIVFQLWLAPMIWEENRQAGREIADNTLEADNAVQEYRWFRTQWYDIQSQREQLENYRAQEKQFHKTWSDDPENWTRQAQTRHGRIHDRVTGTENMVADMVADYNARQSDATRAIFQCGLPYNVDEKLFIADATGVEYTSQDAKSTTPPEDPADCKFAGDPGEESS